MRNVLLLGILCVLSLSAGQKDTPHHIKDQNPDDWETIKKCILLESGSKSSLYTYRALGYNNTPKPRNAECKTVFDKYQNRGWLLNSNHPDINALYHKHWLNSFVLSLIDEKAERVLKVIDSVKNHTRLSEDDKQHIFRTKEIIENAVDETKKEFAQHFYSADNNDDDSDQE